MTKKSDSKAAKDSKQRRDTLRAATPSNITAEERKLTQEMYKYARSKSIETGEQWDVDHIIPLAKGGLHTPDNLQILPKSINQKKGDGFDGSGKPEKGAILHTTIQKMIEKESKKRTKTGTFAPGVSGNSKGRPKNKVEGVIDPTIFERLEELCDNYKGDEQAKTFFRIEIDLLKGSSDFDMVTKKISELRTFFMTKKKDQEEQVKNVVYHFVSQEEIVDKILKNLRANDENPTN